FTEKHGKFFRKYSYFALALIISIPFTGMGSWAGALLSNLTGLRKKYSSIAIAVGILISGLITILMAYGLLSLISSRMASAAMITLNR
ncbi:MAG: small multi-drug export protein, partial [Eubacterium sp.]|nr:small multi-drug export protein [Eubacterium sp.]